MIEKSLKIFFRELKKFCSPFSSNISTLFDKYQSLVIILGIFVIVFALATFMVNLWLKRFVVRPLNRMAQTAEAVSMGNAIEEFTVQSEDEVGQLATAFNRMRMSLQMAMKRLERYRGNSRGSNFSQ